ncbi:hypothetical protein JCM10207_002089 [Rhodosporidiobolus poonsookiae]
MSWYSTPSTTADYSGTWWGQSGDSDGGFSNSWVTWVSIIIVAGVIVALLCSRFFYIRRYYPPTWRSYFIPAKGIHIRWLGLHIRGPPARIPCEPPPSYYATTGRRRRRNRETNGATVGAGGTRLGTRDEDDGWDDDDLAERGALGAPALPAYHVDIALPGYDAGDGSAAAEAERIRAIAAADESTAVLPTAAEYEAQSRNARDAAAARDSAAPSYPPPAHLPSSAAPAPSAPSRPATGRSTTARSGILSLAALPFRRAPSPSPAATSPTSAAHPRASTSSDTLHGDDESDRRSIASGSTSAEPGRIRRSSSSASGSSGGTKLGDDEGAEGLKTRKGKKLDDEAATASSSRVKLGGGDGECEKAEEEKVERAGEEPPSDSRDEQR